MMTFKMMKSAILLLFLSVQINVVIMTPTHLSWLQAFFKQNNVAQESRFNLKKNVEEEYRKWKSMAIENDIITHFSLQGSPPLFLCLLWKMLLETDHINQIGFRSGVTVLCP